MEARAGAGRAVWAKPTLVQKRLEDTRTFGGFNVHDSLSDKES